MTPGDIRNDLLRIVTSQFTMECINCSKAIVSHCDKSNITAIRVKGLREYLQKILGGIPGNIILKGMPDSDANIISIFRESLRRLSFDLDKVDFAADEWLLYKFLQLGDAVLAADLINTGGYPFPDPRKYYEQIPALTELAMANVNAVLEPVIVMGVKASSTVVEAEVEPEVEPEVVEEIPAPAPAFVIPENVEVKQDNQQRGKRR